MKPMTKNKRESVVALIVAMYADFLNELPENEFMQECRRLDASTHLLSAANCLIVAKHKLMAQR